MTRNVFRVSVATVAVAFSSVFCVVVLPPLVADPDILAAFAAGFVNPYASGYSADVFACWMVLALWVAFESKRVPRRVGLVSLALGVVPGVAVGFAAYLLLRPKELEVE